MAIQGYPSATSVVQGGYIGLHISADGIFPVPFDLVHITVSRVGSSDKVVWSEVVEAGPQPEPDPPDGARLGFGWPETIAVPIGADWTSGLYRVHLDSSLKNSSYDFHIVVRAADPGTSASTLLMYPATTGQAYNTAGGLSLYEFNDPEPDNPGVAADQVSFDRPGGLDYDREVPFARWFDANGFATEACTNIDVHANPELLFNYRLVVSMGHDEYWSREMRDAVESFVTSGGNAAFLSGNVCWWQVRFSDDNRIMICHKDATTDPLAGIDNSRVTVNWADYPVCRPENTLTGVGWRKGGAPPSSNQSTIYCCRFPEHWVFDQTGLVEGGYFGKGFIGYETDTCDFEEIDGRPQATGADGTPPSFVILATADYSTLGDVPGYATMGLFRRGGWVFTAASTDWGKGLQQDGDPYLQTITSNVVSRLSGPDPDYGWERIGEAIDVVAMAAEGGQLFAAISDGQLWQRPATAQNLHWQPIGEAGEANVIAMAANGYAKPTQKQKLYAIDDEDRLLQRDPDPQGTWSVLTTANGCTALAVNNQIPPVLFLVDSSNTLWTYIVSDNSWDPLGTSDIQVRCLAAQYRSLIACDVDGQLWRRSFWYNQSNKRPDSVWEPFGKAVSKLIAMAITEGTLYAATSTGELWRRDLTPSQAPDSDVGMPATGLQSPLPHAG